MEQLPSHACHIRIVKGARAYKSNKKIFNTS